MYLPILLILMTSISVQADIYPKHNQIGVGLLSGSINNFNGSNDEVDLNLGFSVNYGLTENIAIGLDYNSFDISSFDISKVDYSLISLGANYHFDYLYDTTISLDANVTFIKAEYPTILGVSFSDQNGTSIELGAKTYYTSYNFAKPYLGLSYKTDASSEIKYKDNLFEHVGFVVTATDNLNISLDYELSQEAITYSAEFLFDI